MVFQGVSGKHFRMLGARDIATRCLVHLRLMHRAIRLTGQLARLQCSQPHYPQNENEDSNALEDMFPMLRISSKHTVFIPQCSNYGQEG